MWMGCLDGWIRMAPAPRRPSDAVIRTDVVLRLVLEANTSQKNENTCSSVRRMYKVRQKLLSHHFHHNFIQINQRIDDQTMDIIVGRRQQVVFHPHHKKPTDNNSNNGHHSFSVHINKYYQYYYGGIVPTTTKEPQRSDISISSFVTSS